VANTQTTSTKENAPGTSAKRRYELAKFEPDLLKADRKICHESSSPFSFLALPSKDGQEGLFPAAEISMFAGASGAWKTSVVLLFIKKWEKGEHFFGRPTCPGNHKYLIVSFDRSKEGFARTAVRMGYDPNEFDLIDLGPDEYSDRDPGAIIEDILNQPEYDGVRFVLLEGIDLKVGDVDDGSKTGGKVKGGISDAHVVAKLLRSLKRRAQEKRFAIIVSVGSPKQKAGNKYTSKRDQVLGSAAWARMVETLVFLEQAEDTQDGRTMSFLPRNGRDEEVSIVLDPQNRPTAAPQRPAQSGGEKPATWKLLIEWIRSNESGIKPGDEFTVQQVAAAFPDLKADTIQKTLKRMVSHVQNRLEETGRGSYRRLALKDIDI
jgi:hypothetical protein